VTAVVVAKPNDTLTAASIIAALNADIAAFKVPKCVLFVPELPRNAMGKVQKNGVARDVRRGSGRRERSIRQSFPASSGLI